MTNARNDAKMLFTLKGARELEKGTYLLKLARIEPE
jgi:hypothetical protein